MLSSPVDIAIIAGIALLFFGPKKLPELGKALGQGIGNFKKGIQEAQDEVKNVVKPEKEDKERIVRALGMDESSKQEDVTS